MATTPSGNLSVKPRRGRQHRRMVKIEIVARLEAQFIQDPDIAHHLGMTVGGVQAIKRSPEFLAQRAALQTGVMTAYDSARLATEEAQRAELDSLVPAALNAVKNVLLDKNHPQHSRVAMDVLDRNKHVSKVSRMMHSVEKAPDTSEQDRQSAELLALLGPGTVSAPIETSALPVVEETLQLADEALVEDEATS